MFMLSMWLLRTQKGFGKGPRLDTLVTTYVSIELGPLGATQVVQRQQLHNSRISQMMLEAYQIHSQTWLTLSHNTVIIQVIM